MHERPKLDIKEKGIISAQMQLYGKGEWQKAMDLFDYRKSELDPSYGLQVLNPFIEKTKRNNPNPCILDLGAGVGEAGAYMKSKGVNIIKADISRIGLKGKGNATQALAWTLPFANKAFDGIHSKDMMTHIPPQFRPKLFYELNRVTKPEGRITVCSVNQEGRDLFQYPTIKEDLIRFAGWYGFSIENSYEWKPNGAYKDWYKSRAARFVLELKKSV